VSALDGTGTGSNHERLASFPQMRMQRFQSCTKIHCRRHPAGVSANGTLRRS